MLHHFEIFAVLGSLINADPCRFESAKGVIDISSLGRTDGKAAFPDKSHSGFNYKYSYNPCKPFNQPPSCIGVAACQVSVDGLYSFDLGTQDSASWNPGATGSPPTITYKSASKEKTAIVILQCPTDGSIDTDLEALGEGPTNTYKFRLTDKCSCWNRCGATPTTIQPPCGDGSSVFSGRFKLLVMLHGFFCGVYSFFFFYKIYGE